METFKTTKAQAFTMELSQEMISETFRYYSFRYGYEALFNHLKIKTLLIDDSVTYTMGMYLNDVTRQFRIIFEQGCNHFEDEAVIDWDIIRMLLKEAISMLDNRHIDLCYISEVYFDGNTCNKDIIAEDEHTTYYVLHSVFVDSANFNEYINTNGLYVLKSNCIEAVCNEDGGTILIPCWETTYTYDYRVYTYRGALRSGFVVYGGDLYHEDDCIYCTDTGNHIPVDYAHYNEDNDRYYEHLSSIERSHGVRGYHSSKIEDKSNGSMYKIGFEVEKEDEDFDTFKDVRKIGWDAEHDGSLDENGFELISPIYDLNNMDAFNKDIEPLRNILSADASTNCGGHINISVEGKNAKEIFALIQGYTPLIYAMFPTRINNRYCEAKKLGDMSNSDRYQSINFTKNNILELRIFSRVKNASQLAWRYRLIQYLFNNQRKGAASIVRMLLTDSPLKAMLLEVYSLDSYNTLVDRVVTYTDIYMSSRDAKTTATLIRKMKDGGIKLSQLLNNK